MLRAGADLDEKLRQVPKGTPVEVLELRQGEGQQMRARIRYEAKGFMWFSEGFKEGWVTSVQADGVHLLVAPTLDQPESPNFGSSPGYLPSPARLPPPSAPAPTSARPPAARKRADPYDA